MRASWKHVMTGIAAFALGGVASAQMTTMNPGPIQSGGSVIIVQPKPKPQPKTAKYDELDNVEGSFVHFGYPPVRPMATDGLTLYAVNNHDNTVQRYTNTTGQPSRTYRVPWGPVSIAVWHDPDASDAARILVVSRGNPALSILDAESGETLAVLPMEHAGQRFAEPGDIIVDDDDRAFVSCSASQAVLEFDLRARASARAYFVDGVNPLYLSFDGVGNVLVAPLLSGNASGNDPEGAHLGSLGIHDLDPLTSTVLDPAVVDNGLPDEDLFRIRTQAGGKVEAVARAMGAICFEHRRHPLTGDVWMLNTFARNKELEGEPAHRGVFARNELSIVTVPPATRGAVTPARPHTTIDLDLVAVGGSTPDPTLTVGQPMSFDFDGNGNALIAGTGTNNFIALDSSGNFLGEVDLPKGAIPRQVLYSSNLNTALLYCWGTNEVLAYSLAGDQPNLWATFDLGFDPTPALIAAGREVFYDASHSLNNNLTCATCHVDGRTDNLVWDLGSERDPKGSFMTQTLAGIERVAPFHWRGERGGLIDFNPAFTGLLGAASELDTTAGEDFDAFEAFVFSIANPPNFIQNRERLIDDEVQPKLVPQLNPPSMAFAVDGRTRWNAACLNCHRNPMATNSDFSRDGEEFSPKQIDRKVASFQEILRRDFDADLSLPGYQAVQVFWDPNNPELVNNTFYPLTGAALASRGLVQGIHAFSDAFPGTPQVSADVASFMSQFDQGVAPAAQQVFLINASSDQATIDSVRDYLVPQATTPYVTLVGQSLLNCGLAVRGTVTGDSGLVESAWYYDPDEPVATRFVPEDSSMPKVDLDFFLDQAAAGDASVTFMGTPTGMAKRFAVDRDADELFNADEALHGTESGNGDTDGDGFPDGYEVLHGGAPLVPDVGPLELDPPSIVPGSFEVLWNNGKVARIRWETDEPATSSLVFSSDVTTHAGTATIDTFETLHSVVLNGMQPSAFPGDSTYSVWVKVTDPSGNDNTAATTASGELLGGAAGGLVMDGFGPRQGVRLTEVKFTNVAVALPGPGLSLCVRARVVQRRSATTDTPVAGYKVIGKVYRNGDSTVPFSAGSQQTFTITTNVNQGTTAAYDSTLGDSDPPFAISPVSDANGYVNFCITVPSAVVSDTIEFVVEAVALPDATGFHFVDILEWSLPDTLPADRIARHN